jgi:hypothetical protein
MPQQCRSPNSSRRFSHLIVVTVALAQRGAPKGASPAMALCPHALFYGGRDYRSCTAHYRSAFSHVRDRQIGRRKDGGREIPGSQEGSRAWLALGYGMFAKQPAPYLPNFPFSPTEAKFISAPIDFRVLKTSTRAATEEVILVE